ncbi:MAG: tyrosine-type recombinase/integrase [Saprospiraceae bacterium]|nr:tyrosine-type recombinase/integrase [Saprospiraceae bacterium]MCB9323923.1 tyrosine-type recombinase/integrase [Lewinellaceae bacterium]
MGPKWKFVTTHTARRSAATNLALQNVNIKIIADLGGWTDIRTLRSYLRASGLDSALVAGIWIFLGDSSVFLILFAARASQNVRIRIYRI